RLIGAYWLPNAFGDAYAYTEQIYYLRRAILQGTFSLSSLFGFWLPLYQLICAVISAIAGSPVYVPKLVSAFCGGGVSLLVLLLTWQLTASRSLSLAAAAIAAVNPYHVLYSASAMTDIPHAFVILLCAYCCIRDRFVPATLWALIAGLIRIESWVLIPIIPLAYLLKPSHSNTIRNRIRALLNTTLLTVLLCAGPVFWLVVTWRATGTLWKYFEIRNNYIVETLASSPWLAHLSLSRVGLDSVRLVYTSNPIVLYFAVVVLLVLFRNNTSGIVCRVRQLLTTAQGLVLAFFFAHLIFLVVAYLTRNQPEIWPRYGLIFFSLGLPLLAYGVAFCAPPTGSRSAWNLRLLYLTGGLFALQFCVQLIDVTRIVLKPDNNLITAQFLEDQRRADDTTTIYCEDGAIRVLSGIPLEEFKDQYNSPADANAFMDSLKKNQVRLLVYKDLPGSRLKELIASINSRQQRTGITLEKVIPKPRNQVGSDIIVYRIHEGELAEVTTKHRGRSVGAALRGRPMLR
ncbi:MAG TPA: hypothetical protein VLB68_05795, partial [Pyrinomonadaceae bacterium]|nr:hypothetical protein [Pyrinomonadaceae bacterium]